MYVYICTFVDDKCMSDFAYVHTLINKSIRFRTIATCKFDVVLYHSSRDWLSNPHSIITDCFSYTACIRAAFSHTRMMNYIWAMGLSSRNRAYQLNSPRNTRFVKVSFRCLFLSSHTSRINHKQFRTVIKTLIRLVLLTVSITSHIHKFCLHSSSTRLFHWLFE